MENNLPIEKKGNSRILIIVSVIALLCCCLVVVGAGAYIFLTGPAAQSVTEQISGGIVYNGIADEELKADVINAIADYETSLNGCVDVSLVSGLMLLSPDQTQDGSWSETWQVGVCGESHLYSVAFTPSPAGGTDFSVTRLDQ